MTSIFKKLTDAFKRPVPTGNPYGLTNAQVAAFRRLRASDDYQVWRATLDDLVRLRSEALLAASSSYEDSALKHEILGLRRAGTFMDEVIQRVDSKEEHERKRRTESAESERVARKRALYGTPFATGADLFGS